MLTLIGGGLSNDEIGTALIISVKTVKSHITHLMAKLVARDRAQLVIAAFDAGWSARAPETETGERASRTVAVQCRT